MTRALISLLIGAIGLVHLANEASAQKAMFRVLEGELLPGGQRAAIKLAWTYDNNGASYSGRGVKFFIHAGGPPGNPKGDHGIPAYHKVDMSNGKGMATLLVDLPPGTKTGAQMTLTGKWPNGHKWGTDKARKGGEFKLKATSGKPPKVEGVVKVENPIDINAATADQLRSLRGVGAALAQKIIARRPINNVRELCAIRGLGKRRGAELAPQLRFPSSCATPNSRLGRRWGRRLVRSGGRR